MDQRGCYKSNSEVNRRLMMRPVSTDGCHTDPTLRATLRSRSRSCKRNMPKTERRMDSIVGIARSETSEYCMSGESKQEGRTAAFILTNHSPMPRTGAEHAIGKRTSPTRQKV